MFIILAFLFSFSISAVWASDQASDQASGKTLVLLELAGGNDGLNTVIPYRDPVYAESRPSLAFSAAEVLPLNTELGLNPALKPLMESWSAGNLAIVLGVGYPNPNRSHFRSIDIWETASASNEFLSDGWITRLYTASHPWRAPIADGIVLGETRYGPFRGKGLMVLSMKTLDSFLKDSATLNGTMAAPSQSNPIAAASSLPLPMDTIIQIQDGILRAARELTRLQSATPIKAEPSYPDTPLAKELETAAKLIKLGAEIPVIKTTLRGFDTHAGQRGDQDRLLGEMAAALAAFRSDLISAGMWQDVTIVSYSEFGRRVKENGSEGTDHGTAAPLFVLGGTVKGGLYGEEPSLAQLQDGDLIYTTDFRSVYRTIAEHWFGISSSTVLDTVLGSNSKDLAFFVPLTSR